MAEVKIKLCGMTRGDDIKAANTLLPDFIGFVFVPGRKRYVSPALARSLRSHLDPRVSAVGVFIDEKPENVAALCRDGTIDAIQLHGQEGEAYITRLRSLTRVPVIRAFRVRTEDDVKEASLTTADMVMLDAGAGSGETFDWSLIINFPRPFFLAGGLNAGNVAAAINAVRPYGVDVSSGIETNEKKDALKMRAFVRAVRDAT